MAASRTGGLSQAGLERMHRVLAQHVERRELPGLVEEKLGDRIKDLKVTVVLEPLNKGETNILNSVAEGIPLYSATVFVVEAGSITI